VSSSCLLCLLFEPEVGGSMLLRNVCGTVRPYGFTSCDTLFKTVILGSHHSSDFIRSTAFRRRVLFLSSGEEDRE
jgi:hypothetical protein